MSARVTLCSRQSAHSSTPSLAALQTGALPGRPRSKAPDRPGRCRRTARRRACRRRSAPPGAADPHRAARSAPAPAGVCSLPQLSRRNSSARDQAQALGIVGQGEGGCRSPPGRRASATGCRHRPAAAHAGQVPDTVGAALQAQIEPAQTEFVPAAVVPRPGGKIHAQLRRGMTGGLLRRRAGNVQIPDRRSSWAGALPLRLHPRCSPAARASTRNAAPSPMARQQRQPAAAAHQHRRGDDQGGDAQGEPGARAAGGGARDSTTGAPGQMGAARSPMAPPARAGTRLSAASGYSSTTSNCSCSSALRPGSGWSCELAPAR